MPLNAGWVTVPHTNTMLSPDRSDIGAAVKVSDQIYIVLETALQTNSGEMQTDAYEILTAIAQGGYSGDADSLVPQYIIPVKRSTARPSGDVIHKVQYGQSLWSIAITYNTTINQIRAWNNLGKSIEIYDGQILLVQMGATQPPPPTNDSSGSSHGYQDHNANRFWKLPNSFRSTCFHGSRNGRGRSAAGFITRTMGRDHCDHRCGGRYYWHMGYKHPQARIILKQQHAALDAACCARCWFPLCYIHDDKMLERLRIFGR